jgi:hypothetical protein
MNTRLLSIVLLFVSAGCASYDGGFSDYGKSDFAVITGELPTSPKFQIVTTEVPVGVVEIDARKVTPPLALRGRYKVSPGPHRLSVKVVYPPEQYPVTFDLDTPPHRLLRLIGTEDPHGIWVQVWDETDGYESRRLVKEVEVAAITPYSGNFQINPSRRTH